MRMLANLVTLLICFGIRIAIGLRAIVKRQGRAEAEGQRQRGREQRGAESREGQRGPERARDILLVQSRTSEGFCAI